MPSGRVGTTSRFGDGGDGNVVRPNPDLEQLRQKLARAVERVCPPALAAQREDIIQAALIKVSELLRRGEHNEIRTSSYLWQVAYSATVDEIRRATRRREVGLDLTEEAVTLRSAAPDPEQRAHAAELGETIRECLTGLIRPRRLVVALHLFGVGAEEAVKVLGWDLKRVRNLTYRGLADLRSCLARKGVRP